MNGRFIFERTTYCNLRIFIIYRFARVAQTSHYSEKLQRLLPIQKNNICTARWWWFNVNLILKHVDRTINNLPLNENNLSAKFRKSLIEPKTPPVVGDEDYSRNKKLSNRIIRYAIRLHSSTPLPVENIVDVV